MKEISAYKRESLSTILRLHWHSALGSESVFADVLAYKPTFIVGLRNHVRRVFANVFNGFFATSGQAATASGAK